MWGWTHAYGSPDVATRAVGTTLALALHGLILFALLRVTTVAIDPPMPPAGELHADRLTEAGERIVSVEIGPGLASRSPACAGLRHDDIVLNPEVWRDAHQEGVVLLVRVLRDGARATLAVRVGRICIG